MSKYLLSICIPTNGVSRWVVPNVRQIYSLGTDNDIFEVVVADNAPNEEMDVAMAEFSKYSNFRYVKTKAEGFYNITLNVWSCNPGAVKFYETMGLKPQKIGMEIRKNHSYTQSELEIMNMFKQ